MRKRLLLAVIVGFVSLGFVFLACGPKGPETIKIGINAPITGDIPKVGEGTKFAAQMWLADVLTDGSGRADAVLFCTALKAGNDEELRHVDATGRAFAASSERLRESLNQGAAFARTVQGTVQFPVQDMLLPVAVGWASAQVKAPETLAVSLYLQAFVSNIVMACVRLLPLGQTQGQAIIQNLAPLCQQTANAAANDSLDELYSNTFLSDIAAMRHEVQQPRLFQS